MEELIIATIILTSIIYVGFAINRSIKRKKDKCCCSEKSCTNKDDCNNNLL